MNIYQITQYTTAVKHPAFSVVRGATIGGSEIKSELDAVKAFAESAGSFDAACLYPIGRCCIDDQGRVFTAELTDKL